MKLIIYTFIFFTLFSCYEKSGNNNLVIKISPQDSIVIFVEFNDCGEWGGHREEVSLFKNQGKLVSSYYKDTVSCDDDPNEGRKKIIERKKEITFSDEDELNEYISKFIKISALQKKEIFSHSCTFYKVLIKDTLYKFYDENHTWESSFNSLKKALYN